VSAVNDSPSASVLSFSTNEDVNYVSDGTTRAHLAGTDIENSAITCAKASDPSHGAVTVNSDCSYTYAPTANYNGSDSFTFTVSDGALSSSAATATITVSAVNDAPSATLLSFSTNEDVNYVSDGTTRAHLAGTDIENSALTCAKASDPSHGAVTVNSDCSFSYAPTANYNGSDSFTFTVSDGSLSSSAATATITVSAVNDAPSATALSFSTNEDVSYVSDGTTRAHLAGTDIESSALTCAKASDPSHGAVTVNSDCSFSYAPTANYNGSDSFTFTVSDSVNTSAAATATITVSAVNDAPSATALSFSTNEDVSYVSDGTTRAHLAGVDAENSALGCAKASDPSHGAVTVNSDCSFSYAPTANYNGSDSFTFTVSDGALSSSAATATITVSPVNDAPTSLGPVSTVTTSVDVAASITLTSTDVEASSLTYTVTSQPVYGTLSGTPPNLTYTPLNDWAGNDSFQFSVSDGELSSSATVTILVNDTFESAADQVSITYPSNNVTGLSYVYYSNCSSAGFTASTPTIDPLNASLTNNSKFKVVVRSAVLPVSISCQSGTTTCAYSNAGSGEVTLLPGETKSAIVGYAMASITYTAFASKTYSTVSNLRYVVNVIRDPGGYLGTTANSTNVHYSTWKSLLLGPLTSASATSDPVYAHSPEVFYKSFDLNTNYTNSGTTEIVDGGCGGD